MALISQLVLLSVLSIPQSQPKPNFAGTWVPVEGVNPVVDLVVTQSSTLLTAQAGDEKGHGLEYSLDGVETQQKQGGKVKGGVGWRATGGREQVHERHNCHQYSETVLEP